MHRRTVAVAVLAAATVAVPMTRAPAAGPRSMTHLKRIVELSPAPEYRRFGTPGMVGVAGYLDGQLAAAGYAVVRHEFTDETWLADYAPGHQPLLQRVSDGRRFKADAVLASASTPAEGLTCTVRAVADVRPGRGDCGWVPFAKASPEWKNIQKGEDPLFQRIEDQGGVGVVVQGDVHRDLVFLLRQPAALPAVVAVAPEKHVVGQKVRLRAMNRLVGDAPGHNVVGVLRPPAGGDPRYVVLQAHADGWYQAAADNGTGTAAVLRAAELLADQPPGIGVLVAFYDGEEAGLLGSKHLATDLSSPAGLDVGDGGPPVRMDQLAAVINLDASAARASEAQAASQLFLGRDVPVFAWRAMVFSEAPVLSSAFLATFAAHGVPGAPFPVTLADHINGGISRTDGKWFHEAGVPVVWPVTGYPEYHTDGDTLDAVDPVTMEAIAEATVDLTRQIPGLPSEP